MISDIFLNSALGSVGSGTRTSTMSAAGGRSLCTVTLPRATLRHTYLQPAYDLLTTSHASPQGQWRPSGFVTRVRDFRTMDFEFLSRVGVCDSFSSGPGAARCAGLGAGVEA